jgi:hypothetical protein
MKKISILLCIVIIFSFAITPGFAGAPNNGSNEVIVQPYTYPIINNDSWKKMSRDERIAACQIPDDKIDKMSTDALLNSILNNPFMIDILAFDTYQDGFKKVYEEIPAFHKLVKRSDFSGAFMQNCAKCNSNDSIKNNDIKTIYSSILVAQPEIGSFVSLSDKEAIIKSLGENTVLLNSLKENMIATTTTSVNTPNGTAVSVINESGVTDWTAAQKSQINASVLAAYPNNQVISNPTKKYNCHSYAWYSKSTSNHYWMNDPSAYMSDGSYYNAGGYVMAAGDKIHWNDGSHSAIVQYVGQSYSKYISKWGSEGVYTHYLNDCPYTGSVSRWRR